MLDLFVTCSSGLEPQLMEELASLGYAKSHPGFRGVYLQVELLEAIYHINYCSRLAGRVLLPLKNFRCIDRISLYRAAQDIDWSAYIPLKATLAIDCNVNQSCFTNSLFAAQVMKDGICDQLRDKRGERPNVNLKEPDVQLNLFIHQEKGIISFDTSGVPLYKRGYRIESVEAPLQESLAAAFLMLANYEVGQTLCDPCCGSGTLLIEAALRATNTPPGYLRSQWGFMRLPDYKADAWAKVKGEADQKRLPLPANTIFGADISRTNVGIAKRNLRAAGFQEIEVVQSDLRDYIPPTAPQIIITNPPHGLRLQETSQLIPLYRALGDFMKKKAAKPGRGYLFTGSLEFAKEVGLNAKRRHVINNSGIDSRLLEFELY